jgi:hypothetical protein
MTDPSHSPPDWVRFVRTGQFEAMPAPFTWISATTSPT